MWDIICFLPFLEIVHYHTPQREFNLRYSGGFVCFTGDSGENKLECAASLTSS